MMSENKDLGINLGLSLGPTSHGAGASMTLALPAPVSELVWKCAKPITANRWPFLPSRDSPGPDKPIMANRWPFLPSSDSPCPDKLKGIGRVNDAAENSKKNYGLAVEGYFNKLPESAQSNYNSRFETNASRKQVMSIAIPLSPEPQKLTQPNSSSQQESDDEVNSAPGKAIENKIEIPIRTPGPVTAPNKAYSSCQMGLLYGEKGKGKVKALSDGYECKRSSNDNRENAENHNSTSFCSRGVKRLRSEVGRSKTARMRIEESHCILGHGSSFMNWVSNMTKDSSVCNKKLEFSLDNNLCENEKDNNSCRQIIVSDRHNNCAPENTNQPAPGLWITRLYTKKKGLEEGSRDKRDCVSEARDDPAKRIQRFASKGPDDGSTSLETLIMSVFAKRMDSLKHIMDPPEKFLKYSMCKVICYFCGENGHDLRKCPELAEAELEDLLTKISLVAGVEKEYPCLCISCFELGHWAIKCPARGQFRNIIPSDSSGNRVTAENEVGETEVFRAVRKLRLSRADIIRWMNSDVSLSRLNGFFLRLRLQKLEAKLEGSGYYVARITEDTEGNIICCSSKKPILVDVGGFKLHVEIPYVSNHDFVEDEIMAWWGRIREAGAQIPSLAELETKVEDKTSLGF
ncbi:zinc knuckle (CCHC-type) family protein [Striga hermonthica]|uniref:Zinc knuckle (CCHC-type) family protein n=1 Tax=Striga hermonthica TaxID=68872 RepID=A0A9N7MC10_STRHE|nr:zinc knuckle (CCHC-type) family protein [Striga hermonthica]